MDEYEKAGADRAVDLLAQIKHLKTENKRLRGALSTLVHRLDNQQTIMPDEHKQAKQALNGGEK